MSLADQALRRRRPRRSAFHCHPERNGSVERRNIGKYQSCWLEIARRARWDPAFTWRVIRVPVFPWRAVVMTVLAFLGAVVGVVLLVRRVMLTGLLAVLALHVLAACTNGPQSGGPESGIRAQATQPPAADPIRTETPILVPTPTSVPTETPTPMASPSPTLQGVENELSLLVVSVVYATPVYDRAEWRHWIDEDSDCQDTRQEVLIEEATGSVTYADSRQCRVQSGTWTGPYSGEEFTDPGRLDIDHMVPLANAHKSGGWAWSEEKKRQYANDLSYHGHLIAVQASVNRSKGSKGPEQWKPPDQGYWCQYAIDWTTVKARWELFASEAEAASLSEMLEACTPAVTLTVIQHDMPEPAGTPPATSTPSEEGGEIDDALEMYDDNGNGRISCAEARSHGIAPVRRGHPAYRYMNDADNDGVVCE